MWILLGTVFIASLLGSLHCMGMCGPFALLASTNPQRNRSAISLSAAYSLGRLVTYCIAGAGCGGLGMALNRGLGYVSWQQSATYLAGGLMVAIGSVALLRLRGLKLGFPQSLQPLQQWLASGVSRAKTYPPLSRSFLIGAVTTLMPCGWLYTFAITAAGTGSPFWGLTLMAVFWAGTVPIMMLLMFGFHHLGRRVQQKVPAMMAVMVVLIGLFTMVHRAPIALAGDRHVRNDISALTEEISSLNHADLPCCCKHQ